MYLNTRQEPITDERMTRFNISLEEGVNLVLHALHNMWGGEVFAYCTVLGLLAFDYETLRLCGFSWQQFTAIHRTHTLSAFASSLIAALGPLAIAVFQGRMRDIANFALSFLGKLFPETGAGGG